MSGHERRGCRHCGRKHGHKGLTLVRGLGWICSQDSRAQEQRRKRRYKPRHKK